MPGRRMSSRARRRQEERARMKARAARPPLRRRIAGGSATNREFFWSLDKGGEPKFGIRRQPAGMPRDDSLQTLRDAVGSGAAKLGGRSRVLGRPCTIYLYKDLRPQLLEKPSKGD